MTDADIIDFADQYMGQLIHKVGHRWYWSRGSFRTYYRANSLRDAVEQVVKGQS